MEDRLSSSKTGSIFKMFVGLGKCAVWPGLELKGYGYTVSKLYQPKYNVPVTGYFQSPPRPPATLNRIYTKII
jgi:hypothetical protein